MDSRVVITGLGVVTALGNDLVATLERLDRGCSGIGPLTRFDASGCSFSSAAEVRDFQARPYFNLPKAVKLSDRKTQMAVASAAMALEHAGLAGSGTDLEEMGVIVGTGASDQQPREVAKAIGYDPDLLSATDIAFFSRRILSGLSPLWLLLNLPSMVSAQVAIQFGMRATNNTLMTDWISGSQAVGEAFRCVQSGEAEVMLAGGTESPIYPQALLSYAQAGMMDDSDSGADFVVGEGAGFLVLEERQRALERGIPIHAELKGYSSSSGPLCGPETGLKQAMGRALEEAGWTPSELDCIRCAGVHSPAHGQSEKEALKKFLGEDLERIQLLGFKSQIGHTLAASGPIEIALMLASSSCRGEDYRILSNDLGFLGQAATLALSVLSSHQENE